MKPHRERNYPDKTIKHTPCSIDRSSRVARIDDGDDRKISSRLCEACKDQACDGVNGREISMTGIESCSVGRERERERERERACAKGTNVLSTRKKKKKGFSRVELLRRRGILPDAGRWSCSAKNSLAIKEKNGSGDEGGGGEGSCKTRRGGILRKQSVTVEHD